MDFAERLLQIRTEKKLTREKLGKEIGTSGAVIGLYERKERTPSIEVARRIANVLNVSLDYLVGNVSLRLDTSIIKKIEDIQRLPEKDQEHLFYLLDNVVQNFKTKQAFAS